MPANDEQQLSGPSPGSFHILVVDDRELVRDMLCDLIELDGYRVTSASSGEEALEVLRKTPADLVLVDLQMPGMNGWQLMQEVKGKYPDTFVIVITGYMSEEGEAILTDQNIDGYLVKPVDRRRMQTLFRALLFSRNLGRTAEVAVIDDDRMVLEVVEAALGRRGLYVKRFQEGGEALRYIRDTPPDLAIIDLGLPDMNGLEILQIIRDNADTTYMPVLILTATPSRENVVRALELNVSGFIAKPFESAGLAQRVMSVLRQTGR
jgi:DNA-binding response OmpR family regulator